MASLRVLGRMTTQFHTCLAIGSGGSIIAWSDGALRHAEPEEIGRITTDGASTKFLVRGSNEPGTIMAATVGVDIAAAENAKGRNRAPVVAS